MKATPVIHHARTLLGIVFVFAALSLRAQAPGDSTFSISPGDVTEATIDTSGRTRLQVRLTPEKRAELSAFTGRNLNKQVKIVVGGKLRSEPFIRERIADPSMEIFVSSAEDALATVKALLTSQSLSTNSTSGPIPPVGPIILKSLLLFPLTGVQLLGLWQRTVTRIPFKSYRVPGE